MRRVLVTGANGFVGCNIVAAFLEAGWGVLAVDHAFDNPAYGDLPADGLRCIAADCADMPPLTPDALAHAAAVTATPQERAESPEANLRANLESMLSVMEYAGRQGIDRAVFISSAAALGPAPATVIDETRPPQPPTVYGLAKAIMEQTVATMRRANARDFLCARLGSVYGPWEFRRATRPRLSLVARMMQAALTRGEILVQQPEALRQWTYAPDIGRALVALLNAGTLNHALYQLASGERLSDLQVAQMIARLADGVSVKIDETGAGTEPAASSLARLSSSRLRSDVGFSDWTAMSERTLAPALQSIRAQIADA